MARKTGPHWYEFLLQSLLPDPPSLHFCLGSLPDNVSIPGKTHRRQAGAAAYTAPGRLYHTHFHRTRSNRQSRAAQLAWPTNWAAPTTRARWSIARIPLAPSENSFLTTRFP